MRCDYQNVVEKNVIIHGHGAFTMEGPGGGDGGAGVLLSSDSMLWQSNS
jgi:hypothetical protein